MSDFVSYDTSTYVKVPNYSTSKTGLELETPIGNTFAQFEQNAPIGPGTEYEGEALLKKNGEAPFEWISAAMQTNQSQVITGSVYTELEGEVIVEQSFNYRRIAKEGALDKFEGDWDVAETGKVVAAKKTAGFSVAVLAPWARVKFINKGAAENKVVRLFARVQVQGR